ncbi:MAG: FecR domain-containing protein [Bacteroidota bacterium]
MNSINNRIIYLIEKVENGTASNAEREELNTWYNAFEEEDPITPFWTDVQKNEAKENLYHKISQSLPGLTTKRKVKKSYYIVPLSLILLVGLALSYIYLDHFDTAKPEPQKVVSDVKPGKEEALLILADGTKIGLNNKAAGTIARQAQTNIIQETNGFLVYVPSSSGTRKESLINKVSTPVGGTYRIILPDGSKVWLNAASSIEFPSRFNQDKREVRTSGEVYFEVAQLKDEQTGAKIPFRVITAQPNQKNHEQVIEVLGTHFNVNSYADELAIKTTLLEGAVIVSTTVNAIPVKSARLRPGEQSLINQSNMIAIAKNVDLSEAVAWKNGYFEFNNTSLNALMRQISRWYNIAVVYDENAKNDTFYGKIERSYTLKEVLKVLELGNVHFELVESTKDNTKATLKVLP